MHKSDVDTRFKKLTDETERGKNEVFKPRKSQKFDIQTVFEWHKKIFFLSKKGLWGVSQRIFVSGQDKDQIRCDDVTPL